MAGAWRWELSHYTSEAGTNERNEHVVGDSWSSGVPIVSGSRPDLWPDLLWWLARVHRALRVF